MESLKIINLNDDCLYYIFKMLHANELSQTAQTCNRFRRIVLTFNRKFSINIENIWRSHCTLTTAEAQQFFGAIGHHIQSLNVPVKNCENPSKLFNIIQKYCKNIKHLRIEKWLTLNFAKYRPLLSRLESLELEECLLSENDWPPFMFVNAKNNGKMINIANGQQKFIMKNLPKLRSLTLHNCINIQGDRLIEMLSKNTILKHIKIVDQSQMFCDNSRWFDSIITNLKQIECISLDANSTKNLQLNFLSQLPLLKKLQLINYNKNNAYTIDQLLPNLANVDHLEDLDLHSCHLTGRSFNALKKFTKLQALKMNKNYWIFNDNLIELCLNSQLKEFRIFDCLHISDEGVIRFVEMNHQLKILDLSWCYMVTDFAINSIDELLKKDTYRPNLEIIANGRTRIIKSELNVSQINNNIYYSKFNLI